MQSILFIDDHQDIVEVNRSYFAEQGFTATACDSGAQAVSLLRGERSAAPSAGDFFIDRERRIVRLLEHSAVLFLAAIIAEV